MIGSRHLRTLHEQGGVMKLDVLRMLAALCAVPVLCPAQVARQQPKGWTLVWRDEFNGKTLDRTKWNVLLREQSKHDELQYYLPDEVYVAGGVLHIRSQARPYGSMKYTSGRLDTRGKLAPVYGRFEIRARLPGGK